MKHRTKDQILNYLHGCHSQNVNAVVTSSQIGAHLGIKGIVLFGYHTTAKKVSIETNIFKAITATSLADLTAEEVYSNIKNKL